MNNAAMLVLQGIWWAGSALLPDGADQVPGRGPQGRAGGVRQEAWSSSLRTPTPSAGRLSTSTSGTQIKLTEW